MIFGDDTLVDELVECMLSIGSWLSPDYWPSVVVNTCSMVSDVLSIGLHVTLVNKHVYHVIKSVTYITFSLMGVDY